MTPLIGPLALILTVLTLCYVGLCFSKPFAQCVACRITSGDHFCRRCQGTGYRPRLGWQAWNYFTRLYRDTH